MKITRSVTLILLLSTLAFSCCGCFGNAKSKSSANNEEEGSTVTTSQEDLASPELLLGTYIFTLSESDVPPILNLQENSRFSLFFAPHSRYFAYGKYKVENDNLILSTDDGNYTYTFKIEADILRFIADRSSASLWGSDIEDGSVFSIQGATLPEQTVSPAAPAVEVTAGIYVFDASENVVPPSISIESDNTFVMNFSAVSSYVGHGTYEIKGNYLQLNTDDGSYIYTFEVVGEALRFVANRSSTFIWFADFEDGSIFINQK